MTDEQLIAGLRSQDPAALGALAEQYAAPLYTLVHRILAGAGGEPEVEECVSDVLYQAWLRIGQYDSGRAPLKTWLLILAKYQALERRRQLLRAGAEAVVEPPPAYTPEQALVAAEERQAVQAALAELAPLDRELVYRRYFLDERVDALARAMGLSRQAADNRLWRARKQLRARLGGEEGADRDGTGS